MSPGVLFPAVSGKAPALDLMQDQRDPARPECAAAVPSSG